MVIKIVELGNGEYNDTVDKWKNEISKEWSTLKTNLILTKEKDDSTSYTAGQYLKGALSIGAIILALA